ncbi:MAG: DUF192 domain-containing protein [Acidimicrobiia bacterium]
MPWPHPRGWGWLAVAVLLAVGAVAGCSRSDAGTSDTGISADSAPAEPRRPLAGFSEAGIEVRSAAGVVAAWCALLADDEASRAQGMMGQDDLRGYDAMVFRHAEDATGAYYMYRTGIALSVAWFDAAGRFVSSADMAPCPLDDPAACPRYRAAAAYRLAVEVLQGGLGSLGIGPGSHLQVTATGGCGT